MQINTTVSLLGALSITDKVSRKVERCAAIALTKTAQHSKVLLEAEMRSKLDRPTPFTLQGVVVRPANYRNSTIEASIAFKDYQARYMDSMVAGLPFQRGLKRFEKALQAAGVMPKGWIATPARGLGLDGFGNVGRGFLMKIISQIGTELLSGYWNRSHDAKVIARNKKRNGTFFVMLPGNKQGLPPGIYQRRQFGVGIGSSFGSRMVIVYVQGGRYAKRFDLQRIGNRAVDATFHFAFRAAMES